MQQRRLRLGDILDDYCPRERRITNHAVVAMIEDEVKQTRCTTCDAAHEYKQARVPSSRRKKRDEAPLSNAAPGSLPIPAPVDSDAPAPSPDVPDGTPMAGPDDSSDPFADSATVDASSEPDEPPFPEDDGPVHRPLIRATLPRPEGQSPERKAPDFTIRQPGGRFDQQRNGQRHRGRNPGRPPQGPPGGQPPRFGSRRGAGPTSAPGQRQGNRSGAPQGGQRGGRPDAPNRGPRPGGGGSGRKRGR
jgi:hypothetical protein